MASLSLYEVCDPFFRLLCKLNHDARTEALRSEDDVRREVTKCLLELRQRAGIESPGYGGTASIGRSELSENFRRIEPALVFTACFLLRRSAYPFADRFQDRPLQSEWEYLESDRFPFGFSAGDWAFFEILHEICDSRTPDLQLVTVLYVCLGIGFSGQHDDQPERVNEYLQQLGHMLAERQIIEPSLDAKITPQAYTKIDVPIPPPQPVWLTGLAVSTLILMITVFIGNVLFYDRTVSDLNNALQAVIDARGNSTEVVGSVAVSEEEGDQ